MSARDEINVKQAAKLLGVTEGWVRKLARDGKLGAVQTGWALKLSRKAVNAYAKTQRK